MVIVNTQCTSINHIEDATRRSNDDVNTLRQLAEILADICTTDASVTLGIHVIAEGQNDLGCEKIDIKMN